MDVANVLWTVAGGSSEIRSNIFARLDRTGSGYPQSQHYMIGWTDRMLDRRSKKFRVVKNTGGRQLIDCLGAAEQSEKKVAR